MKKVIGITSSQSHDRPNKVLLLPKLYAQAVENAGGIPLLLPIIDRDKELMAEMLDRIDGLMLSGGVDVDPLLFGEEPHDKMGRIDPERDFFDLELAKMALDKDIPVLGICRGCQVLNIAAGGSIIQDIPSHYGQEKVHKHSQEAPRWYPTHSIKIMKETILEDIFGTNDLKINSFHHQSVKEAGPDFIISGRAKDGVVEAIESTRHKYAVGVQWHPELMWKKNPIFTKLFESLIKACGNRD